MNLPWAAPTRHPILVPSSIHGVRAKTLYRAAPLAARLRLSRQISALAQRQQIRVGLSVSLRVSRARSGLSQPMAAVRVGVQSPLPVRSTKQGRLPRPSKIARSCSRAWRDMTRKIRRLSMPIFLIGSVHVDSPSKGCGSVFQKNIQSMACPQKFKRFGMRELSG